MATSRSQSTWVTCIFMITLVIFNTLDEVQANSVSHGWGPLTSMMWADFRTPNLLTDAEAQFLATHYAVLSLEKCTGESDGYHSEQGVYKTAMQLKKINPHVKVFMYWGVMMQGYQCSSTAQKTMKDHPEYFLVDDNGNPVYAKSYPQLDYRRQDARDWWTSIPLSIGPNASKFIDGILADGAGLRGAALANFTPSEQSAITIGAQQALSQMQAIFNHTNQGLVLGNGILMYLNPDGTPRAPDYNLGVLDHADGIESEHVAAFESRHHATGAINIPSVLKNLDLIEQAAAMNKSVMMNEWAGPVIAPHTFPSNTPNTTDEWRAVLSQHFNFSAALFLTVAAPTVFFEYIEWYPLNSGVVPCPTCMAPTNWYPQVYHPVGAPKGPRKTSGTVITRSFENVDVMVDLATESAQLTWKI
eukprot:m.262397 g.262397  ORF g.262397 m.262397 type:complete len:416 (-) comp45461_c0_seq1:82-1329(-)